MKPIPGIEGSRRLQPRLWDYNYYAMRLLGRAFADFINRHLATKPHARVIDLGCGTRPYESLFTGRAEYIGVDVGKNPQADLTIKPGQNVPLPDESADLVLSTQVLEHVVDVESYLQECYRLLKPDGVLILSTHGFWLYHPYPTDVRRWTCWGLRHEIEKHGFHVEVQRGCVGPLAYTTQLRLQLLRGALYQIGPIAYPLIGLCSTIAQLTMMAEDLITPTQIREQNSAFYVLFARRSALASTAPQGAEQVSAMA